jgi:hypothetical protein
VNEDTAVWNMLWYSFKHSKEAAEEGPVTVIPSHYRAKIVREHELTFVRSFKLNRWRLVSLFALKGLTRHDIFIVISWQSSGHKQV